MAPKVIINAKHCKGCRLCIDACPKHALKLTGKRSARGIEIIAFDTQAGCTGCLLCALMCPDAAIEVEVDEETSPTGGGCGSGC